MKEYLKELVAVAGDPLHGRHIAREYLQSRILLSLQGSGAMIPLAFHGGTALRFLFQLPRFSEDLDFALEGPQASYDLRRYLRTIAADLTAENYPVELRVSDQQPVHSGQIRFHGLPRELGLPAQRDETLMIKIEVDTRPPAGAGLDVSVVRRYSLLRLQHHDRASLLSGKLHAILQRPYAKGRDLFDLMWYLTASDWPSPNLALLNNALLQTEWTGEKVMAANWREIVRERLRQLDWTAVVADVRPFLIEPRSADLLEFDTFEQLLANHSDERT